MVAYNFTREFMQAIRSGQKRGTIRPLGKRRHARVGERVQLYTGMRTAHCRLLADRECTGSEPISMMITRDAKIPVVVIGKRRRSAVKLAHREGFESVTAMAEWFLARHGPGLFKGVNISWGES